MNKNKKLIAFICAIAMIVSVFAGMTVVSADEITKGIVLEYDAVNSTANKAVVVAKAVGFDAVDSYTVRVNLPEGATAAATKNLIAGGQEGVTAGIYGYSVGSTSAAPVTDGVLMVIEIALATPLTEAINMTLQAKSSIANGSDKLAIERDNLPVAELEIPVWTDPNATPTPTPEVPLTTRAPKVTPAPTEEPGEEPTAAPTKEPIVVEKGIDFEYSADSTANKPVIIVKAVGFDAVDSYTVRVNLPEGATAAATKNLIAGGQEGVTAGIYGYSVGSTSAAPVTDGILMVIEITLATPLTEDFYVELQAKSSIANGSDKLAIERDNLKKSWVKIPAQSSIDPVPTSTPEPVKTTVKASSIITDTSKINDTVTDGTSDYRLSVVIKNNDGTVAEYGKDFVATIDGTNNLDSITYNNLINGYLDDVVTDIKDLISKLVFKPYNNNMTFTIQAVDSSDPSDEKVVTSGSESTGGGDNPKPPAGPSMSVSNVKATVDRNFDVKTTVKNAKDGAKITYTIVKNSKGDELAETDGSIIQIYGSNAKKIDVDVASNGIATQKFTANKKGTAYIKVQYTDSANSEVASKVISVTVSEDSDSNGGGSSSGGSNDTTTGSGPIAGPSTGGNIGGFITFNDIADVDWAKEAIIMLANKGIISGRGDGIFDPNANITRAEYCQILVGAINKTNESANSSFDDVATDAWYYHAVSVASAYGIVSGYGDGNFGPNNLITRQDMALMTYKAAQVMNKNLSANRTLSFADAGQISDYAKEAVQTLADAGIINGVSDTEFAPAANATRAQSAKILYDTFVKAN